MKNGQNIGYIRVSSNGQNDERQLQDTKLDKIFKEKVSASTIKRKQLQECLSYLRDGDTLHIHSMDRLARNLMDLQNIVNSLIEKGVKIHFHKENLIFSGDDSSISKLLLQVIGAVGEFERNLIKERQMEGIRIAKRKGKHLGRHKSLSNEEIQNIKKLVADGVNKTEISKKYGISRQTVYSYLKT